MKLTKSSQPIQSKSLVLLTAATASSLIMLDSNIVAVSLPSIARSLHATFSDIQWVVSAYVLTFAALLLPSGSLCDLRGRQWAVLVGICLFAIASILCGLAPSAIMLNVARAFQGIGASLLLTASLAIIGHTFQGVERAKAFAFWGSALGIAITSGPIVGGVITNFFGWRWAFLINVPVCVLLIGLTFVVVRESYDPNAKEFDWFGMLTFSSGLFLLTWALIDGNHTGWLSQSIVRRFVGAGLLLTGFVIVELKQKHPMVEFRLFQDPTLLGANFSMLGYAAGAQVMIFFLPLYLQNTFGFSPLLAGLAMLPFALPIFLAPRLGGQLATRYSGRKMLTFGLAVVCAGNLLMAGFASTFSYPKFAIAMVVAGWGTGLLNSDTARVYMGAMPPERGGIASGLSATVRFTGLLIGLAGLGVVLTQATTASFIARIALRFSALEDIPDFINRVTAGDINGATVQLPESIRGEVIEIARHSFTDGFSHLALMAAIVSFFSLVLTLVFVRSADTPPLRR
jgi:EmrB/QacA subfamily drug resistance transporter